MKFLMGLTVVLMSSCSGLRPPPVPIDPGDSDQCAAACAKMASLKCPEAEPLADGTTCKVFCEKPQEAGHALNPTCLAGISACTEIEACTVNREGGR